MMTDVTTTANRQSGMALNYLGHNLGYAVGPIIGGFLFYRATQWLFIGNAAMEFPFNAVRRALHCRNEADEGRDGKKLRVELLR